MENRWGKSGSSDRFYFLGLQITVDGDSTHVIKRGLLCGRKAMTILAQTHIAKGMVFTVVIYRSQRWTIKKAECQRIDLNWGARKDSWESPGRSTSRSNQSISKEINPGHSLEGLMLKLQYSGHLIHRATHWKRPWCWERLKAKGKGGSRGWDG